MAIGEAPVLETLADINAVSIARSELDPATLILVRVAALVAVDAPPASYLMHVGPALESGLTVADIQDVLVAVAPITGAPRVLSAARKITEALGIAIAVMEELAEEEAAEGSAQVPAQASAGSATADAAS
jgi:alkylhydroperoxidase/carboxymuconolactone decarboxylase family protein YurZ